MLRILCKCTLLSLLLFSCKKTVNLKLASAAPQLVIQGVITDQGGPYTVMVTRSVPFYANNKFPGVSGAFVTIGDNTGVSDTLMETSPGTYITRYLQGVAGNTYTLSVIVNDTTYTAVSTMPQPVIPTDLSFSLENVAGQHRITPTIYFQDPYGIKNYYRFEMWTLGIPFTKEIFVFDDRLSDGRPISLDLQMDSSYLQPYEPVQVYMECIDQHVYNYFYQLSLLTGNAAFAASVSADNPPSNISNGAYGYFSAQSMSMVSRVIP